MNPPINSHVKILLKNNITIEGIVDIWDDKYIKLISIDKKSYIILNKSVEDIVLIKVFVEYCDKNKISPPLVEENKTELDQRFQEEYAKPSDDPLRTKKLSELKIMMIEQERQIIANKLKHHHIKSATPVNYSQPNFLKK